MEHGPASRILLVPSSGTLGIQLIKRITSAQDDQLEEDTVQWTISNKYYTADVHFRRANWEYIAQELEPGIPAVVVLWENGEDYQDALVRLTAHGGRMNAEVLLAAVIGATEGDLEQIEDAVSDAGFEFINLGTSISESQNEGYDRIVEALQTVLWPNMQMKRHSRPHHRSQLSTASISAEQMRKEDGPNPNTDNEKKVIEAQSDADDPWPKRTSSTDPTGAQAGGGARFDDDFTEFISAPSSTAHAVSTTPGDAPGQQAASDSDEDFPLPGDEEDYKELLDDEMPSKEEIMQASQRIFGASFTADPRYDKDGNIEEGEEETHGEFDLGSIMGALQNMKEEIAGITDEDEKRKAAARVALGLVWGLERGM